ncbi:MAG: hypothetical protein M3T49_04420 [Candidatus Eremiobacteraeota bacterium]|nr:hypothetical protein [Candidatus Eremiobacteraeota bacterium]
MEEELVRIEWPRTSLGLLPLKFAVRNRTDTWLLTYRRMGTEHGRICSTTFELAQAANNAYFIRYRRHLLDPKCESEPDPPCQCAWKYGAWALQTPDDLSLVDFSSRALYPSDELSFAAAFFSEARQKLEL